MRRLIQSEQNRRLDWTVVVGVALLVLGSLALRSTQLQRPGYTPDEELTYFAVQGISEHGLPTLPSGVLYERGLPYSYVAWLSGLAFGQSVTSYRLPSVFFGVTVVLLVFVIAWRLGNPTTAFLAAGLTAISPDLIAQSQWARFYSMFIAAYLITLIVLYHFLRHGKLGKSYLAALGFTFLLHELSVTLLAVPLFIWAACEDSKELGRRARTAFLQSLLVIAVAQVALLGLYLASEVATVGSHRLGLGARGSFLIPPNAVLRHASWASMTLLLGALAGVSLAVWRRTRVRKIHVYLSLLSGALFQLGFAVIVTIWGVLTGRGKTGRVLLYSSATGLAALVLWTLHTGLMTDVQLSARIASSLFFHSVTYPLEAFRWVAQAWPITAVFLVVFCGLVLSLRMPTKDYLTNGAVVVTVFGILLVLGMLNRVLNPRYFALLLPFTFVGIAQVVYLSTRALRPRLAEWRHHMGFSLRLSAVATLLMFVVIAAEQYKLFGLSIEKAGPRIVGPTAAARLYTVNTDRWSAAVGDVAGNEVVICNDELACQLVLGRVDYWLLTGRANKGPYVRRCGTRECGYYGGAEVIRSPDELASMIAHSGIDRNYLVLLMQTRKFPVADWREILARMGSSGVDATIDQATDGLVMLRIRT